MKPYMKFAVIIFFTLWTTLVQAYTPTVDLYGYDPFKELPPRDDNQPEGILLGHAYIPRGLRIRVTLLEDVNSLYAKERQLIKIAAAENIIINGTIVIAHGQKGTCFILKKRKAGGLGRKGKLWIAGNEITTVTGIPVALCHGLGAKGHPDQGAIVMAAAVSTVGALLMKGTNVHHTAGKQFYVTVREDTDLLCTPAELAQKTTFSK